MSNDCPLCKLINGDIRTKFYYQDEKLMVVDCLTCGEGHPMIVSHHHKPEFSHAEKMLIARLFPKKKIRWQMRQIKSHAHCHIEASDA